MPKKKDSRLARAGVSGFNKPKRTPSHPKKSHVVVAKVGDKVKTIRFGQQGVKTAGNQKLVNQLNKKQGVNLLKLGMVKTLLRVKCQLLIGQIK